MDTKIELLKNVGIFTTMGKEELEGVARYSEIYTYKEGEVVFSEGSISDELYVIQEGEVLITKKKENKEVALASFISGECFGELDLLEEGPRGASARAEKESKILMFPSKGLVFEDVLKSHPKASAAILSKLLASIAGRIRSANKMITERSPWIQDLKKQLHFDTLTGVRNITYFEEDFYKTLPDMKGTTSLLVMKPDNFKTINDTFGHEAGDNALKFLASFLSENVREGDIPVRYEGNVFSVILPETTDEALRIAGDLCEKIHRTDIKEITEGESFFITASIGIARFPDDAGNGPDLFKCAYDRMWQAREAGGDHVNCGDN